MTLPTLLAAIAVLIATVVSGHGTHKGLYHDNFISHDHDQQHHHEHEHSHRRLRVSRNDQGSLLFMNHSLSNNGNSSSRSKYARCGTNDPTKDEIQKSKQVIKKWMSNTELRQQRQGVIVTISTYFHIITTGTTGAITDDKVQKQLTVLNDSFRPYGFTFLLMGTTRTESYDWYYASISSDDEYDMFSTLRVGDASTLNIYFNDCSGNFGYASLPFWYEFYPQEDGVVIKSGTIPGGDETFYDEGKTVVHEVGHWLGLYHTFQYDFDKQYNLWNRFLSRFFSNYDACYFSDDSVDDTPKQAYSTYGCPDSQDTCPFRKGLDPIHNYMDYSFDVCYTEFTTGQMDRMQAMWYEYRG